jgi:hypothetical protein
MVFFGSHTGGLTMRLPWFTWAMTYTAASVLAMGLSGCAIPRLVDTEVATFKAPSTQPQLVNATLYWLEQLPSQNSDADRRVAAMAALSLSGVGLQASPSRQSAHLLVTLTTSRTQQNHAPFEDPPRTGFWFGTAGSGISFQFFEPASNWYQRQLHWVFRSPTGVVLQDIKASHDGRWSDDDTVWQAMLNASLSDFPNAPSERRTIKTDIPR